jgi:hypothetical protein
MLSVNLSNPRHMLQIERNTETSSSRIYLFEKGKEHY